MALKIIKVAGFDSLADPFLDCLFDRHFNVL
jgi:hypothetical protein